MLLLLKKEWRQRKGDTFISKLEPIHWFAVLCVALFLACAPWATEWTQLWVWNNSQPYPWSVLSAHFAHWSWPHFWTNLCAFITFLAIYGRYLSARSFVTYCLAIVISCDVYLHFAYERAFYLGFSSILYGLFSIAALIHFKTTKVISLAVIGFLIFKSLSQWLMPIDNNLYGIAVASDVHIVGMLTGVGLFIAITVKQARI